MLAELGDTSEADRFAKRYARTLEVPDAAACQHLVQLALARVAWLAGDAARARRQLARGLALAETLDGPVPELDRALDEVLDSPRSSSRSRPAPSAPAAVPSSTCCKHCGPSSKPCGNSCISLSKTCHKGRGCAC